MAMERTTEQTPPVADRGEFLSRYGQGERNFAGWRLDGLDLGGTDLRGIDLSGASLVGTNLGGARLDGSDLTRSDLTHACLSRAILCDADLGWSKLSHAELVGTDFRRTKARAVNFTGALLLRARMNDADCLGAIMTGVNATAAQMESVNLECVDLSGSVLMNANLCGANLSWANLTDARMNWATLSWCLLEAADLENANLTGACLQAANLSFANLVGAVLTGADLYFANLSGALLPKEPIHAARISSARLTSQTYSRSLWPRALLREWQAKGAILLDFEAFPRDVQQYIREGECNLRVYFTIPVEKDYRTALEVLIFHIMHDETTLRILSIANEKGRGHVAFYSAAPEHIEAMISAIRERTWMHDGQALRQEFLDYQKRFHAPDLDIIRALNDLADHVCHIQALVPVTDEDKTAQLQARYTAQECGERRAQISWSSITLPKVGR